MGPHKIVKQWTLSVAQSTANRWDKVFMNLSSNRVLISKISKDLKKADYREPNKPIKIKEQS